MIGIGWSVGSSINSQDGENGPQRRSSPGHILNVPPSGKSCSAAWAWASEKGTLAVWPSAAPSLDDRFDQPGGILPLAHKDPTQHGSSKKAAAHTVFQQGHREGRPIPYTLS